MRYNKKKQERQLKKAIKVICIIMIILRNFYIDYQEELK